MMLPRHKASLSIVHNEHQVYYQSIESYVGDTDIHSWRNAEARQRAIDTNEVWEMQWYPDTPVAFKRVYAPTLDELLIWAKQND